MTITYEGATAETRQIIHHHAVLRRGLERHVGALCDAAGDGAPIQRPLAELRGRPADPARLADPAVSLEEVVA